jgi:hypothetical protein
MIDWFGDYKEDRDEIIHYLANFRFATNDKGDHNFKLFSRKDRSWDDIERQSVSNEVGSIVEHLREIMDFLSSRLYFKDYEKTSES